MTKEEIMKSLTSTPTVDIQDYIIDKDPETIGKPPSTLDAFEVVLQNSTDFVIAKTTTKSKKELVILISQNLFYFKDGKSGKIEDVTYSSLKSFFKSIGTDSIKLEQVLWLPELGMDSTSGRLLDIISNEDYLEMCRHNVLGDIRRPSWYTGYWKQNQELFMKLHSIFPTISDKAANKYRDSLPVIFEIEKSYGYNEAMYFAEALLRSGVENYTSDIGYPRRSYIDNSTRWDDTRDLKGFMQLLDEPFNLSLYQLVDYIFFDTYAQGISDINTFFWITYQDFLSIQLKIYGIIKEKYPRYLRTEHDVLVLKAKIIEDLDKCEDFAQRSGEVKGLEYKGEAYSIIAPDTLQQVADEGVSLGNCVRSYVDRIKNDDCCILFLRKSHAPDESLVTLLYCNGLINNVEGLHGRKLSDEERKFLLGWGKKRKVGLAF